MAMRIKAKHSSGYLDISAQETLEKERISFRRSLLPNQIIEIPDEYRSLKNIDNAIKAGLLELLSYDSSNGSLVVNQEMNNAISTATGTPWLESEFIGDDVTQEFVLTSPAKTNNVLAFIDGVRQPMSKYSLTNGKSKILFTFVPYGGANVTVTYQ